MRYALPKKIKDLYKMNKYNFIQIEDMIINKHIINELDPKEEISEILQSKLFKEKLKSTY